MILAHKIRLNPTAEQATYFRKAVGTQRFAYNWALARWKQRKAEKSDDACGPMALKVEFNAIKHEQFPWAYEVSKSACEAGFANLARAMSNYYSSKHGRRKGSRMGFPHFKSKRKARQSFGVANDRFRVDGHDLHVQKCPGAVNMAEALRFDGKIMGATISCTGGRWYISIQVEMPTPPPVEFARESVGVDVGIKSLATLSDGTIYENQVVLRSQLNRLKLLNRRLSRRVQYSRRWYRARDALARFHEGIKRKRQDILHKMTTEIARMYRVVGIEDLNVVGMMHNRRLAPSLADVAFGETRRQLAYKKCLFGGHLQAVARFYASSRLCSDCGAKNDHLTLSDRTWTCVGCGSIHDRDWNASKNIEQESLRILGLIPGSGYVGDKARGQDVRPPSGQTWRKREQYVDVCPQER